MTTLEQGASVTRKTKATIQHKPLVVTMHAEFLELRRFGKRESLTATYESIYQADAIRSFCNGGTADWQEPHES